MSAATQLREAAEAIAGEATMLHPNLTTALLAAINELGVIGKSRTADAGSYSYDYADLEAVTTEVKSTLSKHGLAVRTPVGGHPDGLAVTVQFLHVSGETLDDDPLPFPRGANAQATGSAITYFRRYALLASLNLATGEDDDGAKATQHAHSPAPAWNAGMAKQHVVNLAKGDKALAAEAWGALLAGEEWDPSWDAARLDAAFAAFMAPASSDLEAETQ